jgi:hypothetical protein
MSESNSQQPPAAKNMADIARMFLDGARAVGDAGAPRRVGPGERVEIPVSMPDAKAATKAALPRVTLALLGPEISDAVATERIASAGTRLGVDHGTCVGLLTMHENSLTIDVAGATAATALPVVKAAAGPADVQVARALFTLRHAVGHWIIASPDADHADFPGLASGIADWLIITPTGNDQVVAAYQELKRALAISDPARDPRAVLLAGDAENAGIIHSRLRRAASQFLGKDLELAGIAGLTAPEPLRLATIAVGADEHGAVYAAIVDELCGDVAEIEEEEAVGQEVDAPRGEEASHSIDIDGTLDAATQAAVDAALQADHSAAVTSALFDQLTHVLDPEEREALNAELFAEPERVSPIIGKSSFSAITGLSSPAEPEPGVARSVATVAKEQPKGCTPNDTPSGSPNGGANGALRAFDLAGTSRVAQWEAVESSVAGLVTNAVLLDARAPMSWATESCLALDQHGALHVWTLYKDSVSWFALREWAGEHKALLALTRRDLVLRQDAPIQVHIVLPLEDGGVVDKSEIGPLLRNPGSNVRLYRMRSIEWGGERGVVVVPLA